MAWAGREFAVAQGAQLPAERLLGDRDAELLKDPLRQIDQPPAHHAVNRWDRAALDHPRDGLALGITELRGRKPALGFLPALGGKIPAEAGSRFDSKLFAKQSVYRRRHSSRGLSR